MRIWSRQLESRREWGSSNRLLLRALLAIAATLVLTAGIAVSQEKDKEEDEYFPPFRLKSVNGEDFDSERRLHGKVSIISFWRLEQKRSIRHLEDLVKLREAFLAKDLEILTVVSGETDPQAIRALVQELGLTFPVLLDPNRDVYGAFGVIVSPSSWVVDETGNKRFAHPGHRRGFAERAETDISLLLGRISEQERKAYVEKKRAPRTSGTVGAPVRYQLAKRLLRSGDRSAAIEQMRKAWETEPKEPAAGADLGMLLLEDGELDEALTILEQAALLLPEDPRVKAASGVTLIRLGRGNEGEEMLRWGVEHGVSEPIFLYELGRLSERQGAEEEALRHYRAGLERMLGIASPPDTAP